MMYDFYVDIFDKIKHEESWMDSVSLNISLHESLESLLPTDYSRYGPSYPMTTLGTVPLTQ